VSFGDYARLLFWLSSFEEASPTANYDKLVALHQSLESDGVKLFISTNEQQLRNHAKAS
jgi:hypothetical protein